ncbi:MAG: inositol monophosphatase family protein [Candidatus Paceibacterota bacterium]|jgi:fructose-1,6-bisphosphatase/inositol monophosphatase family enzyme
MNNTNINIKKIMLDMVNKAIQIIQQECHELTIENKVAYDGVGEDFATNGDKKAQEMYVREIKKHFPGVGMIGEEENLRVPCTIAGHDIFFTLDPLDGTKAYKRKQSHGVGTMIALVEDGKIVAAYVGDANTGEVYGYCAVGDGADKDDEVVRHRFGRKSLLKPNTEEGLKDQYILLRDGPHTFPGIEKKFKNLEVGGGSIGTHVARLWKGEVGAVMLEPNYETPWDLVPVLGITLRLGFKFFKIDPNNGNLEEHIPEIVKEVVRKPYHELVVHSDHIREL